LSVRYYSPHRPVAPGTYPQTQKVLNIYNFDSPEYIEEIGRYAWGYIDYKNDISVADADRYELLYGGEKCTSGSQTILNS